MNNKIYNQLEKALEKDGRSAGTLKEYSANIRRLEKFFEGRPLAELTDDDLGTYALYVQKKFSKTTYNSRLASVRYLYTKVLKRKINLEKIPFQRIRKRKSDNN